jgi:hypothetical protein
LDGLCYKVDWSLVNGGNWEIYWFKFIHFILFKLMI